MDKSPDIKSEKVKNSISIIKKSFGIKPSNKEKIETIKDPKSETLGDSPEILQKLSKLEIFSDFAEPTEENIACLSQIAKLLIPQNFKKEDVIIAEGETGDTLYILFDGTVQVMRNTPRDESFAVVNLSTEQNVFFGEIALIDRDIRSASVVALTDCKTLTLTGKIFMELCEKNPKTGYKILYRIAIRMARSLRRSTADIMTLYQALLDEVEGYESLN